MYYFIWEKVIVFDTNLKKVTINNNNNNNNNKTIFPLFTTLRNHWPSCHTILSLKVTLWMKEAFKPYSGFSDEIQTL